MPRRFEIREFPSVDDPRLFDYVLCLQRLCAFLEGLNRAITGLNKNVRVTVGLVVSILSRMIECTSSMLILAIKGRVRDAGILILNLMELRLDLQYAAKTPTLERIWVENANEYAKPWKPTRQIKEVCAKKADAEAELWMYKHLSMIKHGNPAGGPISFRLGSMGKDLFLAADNLALLRCYLFGAGLDLCTAAEASIKIVSRNGICVGPMQANLIELRKELCRVNEWDMTQIVKRHMYGQRPELKAIWRRQRKLRKRKDAVKRGLKLLRRETGQIGE